MTLQSTLQLYHGQIANWLHNQESNESVENCLYLEWEFIEAHKFSIEIVIQEIRPEIWQLEIKIQNIINFGNISILDYCDTLKEAKENAVSWIMKLITKPVL